MKKEKNLIVDQKGCVACRTCELQCAVEHSRSKEMDKAIKEKEKKDIKNEKDS